MKKNINSPKFSADHGGASGATLEEPLSESTEETPANSAAEPGTEAASGATPAPEAQPAFILPSTPPVVEVAEIELKNLVVDAGTQPRVAIDDEVVKEYAEIVRQCLKDEQPIPFPPITVFRDSTGRCVVADGFHRIGGHKEGGATEIECEIREGTERDALIYSLSANQAHGVRRSNRDKQRAVKIAVHDEQLRTLPNTDIARLCGVSEFMVREARPATASPSTRTVNIRGKQTTMNTAAIGKGKGGGKKGAQVAARAAAKAMKAARFPKKSGKGKASAPEGAAKPEAGNESNEQEMDKMLVKIADNVGADGGKLRAAVRDGVLPLSLRDIRDMSGMAPAKQKAILPLVMGPMRMKPAKAFDFIGSELSAKIQEELHNRAIGSVDGSYTFDGEGFKVVVTLAKKK